MYKDDIYWLLKDNGIDDETIYYNDLDDISAKRYETYDDEDNRHTKRFKPHREFTNGDYLNWYFRKAS